MSSRPRGRVFFGVRSTICVMVSCGSEALLVSDARGVTSAPEALAIMPIEFDLALEVTEQDAEKFTHLLDGIVATHDFRLTARAQIRQTVDTRRRVHAAGG